MSITQNLIETFTFYRKIVQNLWGLLIYFISFDNLYNFFKILHLKKNEF